MNIRSLALLSMVLLTTARLMAAELAEVEVDGRAAADQANAREMALTDALRAAVQQGAGVNLLTQTKVRDFALDYDRIFTASFGFVKEYHILSSGVDARDGFYHVRIRATVGQGQPGWDDILALRQLVHMKQSPRIALDVVELIEQLPQDPGYAKAWFEAAADKMQLKLVDMPSSTRTRDRYAARDDFFGDSRSAEYRRAGLTETVDFIIQANVKGRYLGAESLYGSLPQHRFSLTADLRAFMPDSDGIIAVSLPGRDRLESDLDSAPDAARDLVMRYLDGDKAKNEEGAWALFRKIFAQWITELDLGVIMKLELAGISKTEYDNLRAELAKLPEVTAVWPRGFDARGISTLDVETRMDAPALGGAIEKLTAQAFAVDQNSAHAIQFRRATGAVAGSNAERTRSDAVPATGRDSRPLPGWVWALVGAGAVALLGGVFLLGRKMR